MNLPQTRLDRQKPRDIFPTLWEDILLLRIQTKLLFRALVYIMIAGRQKHWKHSVCSCNSPTSHFCKVLHFKFSWYKLVVNHSAHYYYYDESRIDLSKKLLKAMIGLYNAISIL